MTFFGKSMKNGWRSLLWGERAETWDEKLYSLIHHGWTEIFTFFESRRREFLNYTALYAVILIGSVIVLGTLKYVTRVRVIRLRKNDESDGRISEKIISEESRIVSNDGNEATVNSIEKPRPTCRSDLESATSAGDNDHPDTGRESSASSNTTIVFSGKNEDRHFLKKFIDSIEPGDDGVDNVAVEKNTEEMANLEDIPELQVVTILHCLMGCFASDAFYIDGKVYHCDN